MSKNSGKRYRMAFCVVKENISACTCSNQRTNKVFIAVKYNIFIAIKFSITRLSVHHRQEIGGDICLTTLEQKETFDL